MRLLTRKRLLWGAAFMIGAAALFYLVGRIDWHTLRSISIQALLVLCFSSIVMIVLHAAGAATLLAGMRHPASLMDVMMAMLAAGTVSLAGDPKLGVPARLAFYKMLADIPVSVGAAQTTIESLLWLFLMGAVLVIPGGLAGDRTVSLSLAAAGLLIAGIAAVGLGPTVLDRMWVLGRLFRASGPIRQFVFDLRSAMFGIKPLALALATFWLATTYVVDVASIWYLSRALGADLPPVAIGHAIVISYLAGAISLLPLGLGVRDVTFVLLLQQAGAPAETAAALALIHRTVRTALPLLIGFAVSGLIATRSRP
ncbi:MULTISPECIES: lysylphosphatidylglycerol synthase transmembrane domain-containing protein [unclassified Bradyrhizobium]|uniref:lysylphosphatidylglycerol synthase transmembrane domain-containing protein n=1 Tax=unclassified Bradyrhizobium TaxID=2631580 RepID=UPI001BAA57F4|nr:MULTISPECIES: lysylphosphatidylglycerol synthase transmembrane domain-containing protein [unclassified Bradyrhizobium]MBR1203944.1 flippase-like domain-containing protein [Bradyrhizobium sp. AUGA SZCCT0124]MBR1310170.1 flippase-like domain-containing protein [Bradyrhizobium sp. AUGA SZCCT0051]MBR1340311.1 flippase-like domain-containing protein [Bradyrhizobium sp. AUGA SZCCT0105]MBR1354918.1 flippase-like domain-containing protein [Bradyrhizobium sp. AUGA SZCCT0045]